MDAEYYKARAAACRVAVHLADDHGEAIAAEVIRGAMAGFLLSAAHFDGWDALLAHVNQLATADRVPAVQEKFSPRVVRGGRAE
jgi:hypothetical protein